MNNKIVEGEYSKELSRPISQTVYTETTKEILWNKDQSSRAVMQTQWDPGDSTVI